MNYIDKMEYLLSKGFSFEDVAENLYLNYQSVISPDEVFILRRSLAKEFHCNINDVKLIGSSQTGYTYKEGRLQERPDPKDYDFAIVDANTFISMYHKITAERIEKEKQINYQTNFMAGKIHPLYTDSDFTDDINRRMSRIQKQNSVSRHVTVCFYLSEKAFINGLIEYNKNLYVAELRKVSESGVTIGNIVSLPFQELSKMED